EVAETAAISDLLHPHEAVAGRAPGAIRCGLVAPHLIEIRRARARDVRGWCARRRRSGRGRLWRRRTLGECRGQGKGGRQGRRGGGDGGRGGGGGERRGGLCGNLTLVWCRWR